MTQHPLVAALIVALLGIMVGLAATFMPERWDR